MISLLILPDICSKFIEFVATFSRCKYKLEQVCFLLLVLKARVILLRGSGQHIYQSPCLFASSTAPPPFTPAHRAFGFKCFTYHADDSDGDEDQAKTICRNKYMKILLFSRAEWSNLQNANYYRIHWLCKKTHPPFSPYLIFSTFLTCTCIYKGKSRYSSISVYEVTSKEKEWCSICDHVSILCGLW